MDTGEKALRRWKWIAGFAILVACLLLGALLVTCFKPGHSVDERLLGTWQSDADRTIAELRETRPINESQEAGLRKIFFGKMRVTWAETSYTTELDGVLETNPYEVLGRDRQSVAIRMTEYVRPRGKQKTSLLETSEFTVIHFDGPDSYWLFIEVGTGAKEYFKRVP